MTENERLVKATAIDIKRDGGLISMKETRQSIRINA